MPIRDVVSWNSMMKGCIDCGYVDIARKLFDEMSDRTVVSWTTMISGFSRFGQIEMAEDFFSKMPWRDTAAWNSMIFCYCSYGRVEDAYTLFSKMPSKNVISWTTMISGLDQTGQTAKALALFQEMRRSEVEPTSSTLSIVLTACANILALDIGVQLHTHILKLGYVLDPFISSTLITFYARVSEDEILQNSGRDALVVIRLFKLGKVHLEAVYPIPWIHLQFQILKGVLTGFGFACLCIISFNGMYLLHKEYDEILVRRSQHLRTIKHRLVREIPFCSEHKARGCCVDHFFSKLHPYTYQSHQMVYNGKIIEDFLFSFVLSIFQFINYYMHRQEKSLSKKVEDLRLRSMTEKHSKKSKLFSLFQGRLEEVGEQEKRLQELCHKIRNLRRGNVVKHRFPLYKLGGSLAASLLTIFFALPVTAVQGIAKFESLKKWFPPAMAVQLIPGLSSIVTGYLPSFILNMFIYVVPFAMLSLATQGGFVSRSRKEIKACSMVFYFLVGNVFFLSLLSGSLLEQIGESFIHPKDFPRHLASAVSAQADFFMTYILTDALSGFLLEIL
ncbi:hypothetical protein MKX01_039171 [Papaver californicum]|nr:hypothetical protein MKX01_039171 [Papaver californicum]